MNFLDYKNERAIIYFRNKLREIISENEDEFFKCISKEPDENFQVQLPWQEHFTFHFDLSDIDPKWTVSVVYKPSNSIMPFYVVAISSAQLQHFSKFEELKSLCENINYFRQNFLTLEKFLEEESQKYTLSGLLRTYPELYEYTKKRFRFRFKLGPYKDRNKLKELPEHLGDYIRKIQFMEQVDIL
jgi:hypothetical protein